MDYEETLLQVTDVLKAHNRYHMNAPDHEQAVKAIRDIVTPRGEWIPVTERLPDKEGTYLLWGKLADNEDCYCFIGDYDEGCEQFGYWEQQYDPKTLGCLGEDFFKYECVIAWMPLPEPYNNMRGDV